MTSPSPSPETSSVGSQTEIERLVDELVRRIIDVAKLHQRGGLQMIAMLDNREAAFDAARSSLIKYVSDRMLTASEAYDILDQYERGQMSLLGSALWKLRLRSNDAR